MRLHPTWLALALALAFAAAACQGEISPRCVTAADCDDQNPCTDDRCDPTIGCVSSANAAACEDGSACTAGDACAAGLCQPGAAVVCDDQNPCTEDACDPAAGCTAAPNSAPCEDGDVCTAGDACAAGLCQPGAAVVCDDQNPCTDDTCDPATGCEHSPGTAGCEDGDACTAGDACAAGVCQPGAAVVCDDQNPCTDDACDPATGCTATPNALGCEDGDACTAGDACAAGLCQPGAAVVCDDQNPCTDDTCDPAAGCAATPNALACEDGDACTTGDACAAGACQPGGPTGCDDGDGCTADGCDPAAGCTHAYACHPQAACVSSACVCQGGWIGDGFQCSPPCGDGACGADEDLASCPQDCDYDLLLLAPTQLLADLGPQLVQYQADAATEGARVLTRAWTGGTLADLRALLVDERARHAVEGAWLLGSLPAAWYEQTAFETWEEFPTDVYLLDLDATWTDADANGRFEGHTAITTELFVSRLDGSLAQLQAYFAKLHAYRTGGSLVTPSAFIFKDDDWSDYVAGVDWGLDALYTVFHKLEALADTTRANYLARMTGTGAEFVYQWIHSDSTTLYIAGSGGGTVSTDQVASEDHRGSFFNLFDCSGARFTQTNFGNVYLTRTTRGLASIGSTKTGGIYDPWSFHGALGEGSSWGEAFQRWYDATGRWDDEWYLGIVIQGDPLLRLQGDTRGLVRSAAGRAPSADELRALRESLIRRGPGRGLESFADYRARHPEFFRD
ncbi:MAG TPA: hypothetical protein PK668_06955 [Myxococcota bacterium]|nr:hypothetical protein [Myxococcota bacterium]HRY92417.1 hypothetical protein [Myxococcota bacterium]